LKPREREAAYKSNGVANVDASSPYQVAQPYYEPKPIVPFRRKMSSKLNNYKDDQSGKASIPNSRQGRNRAAGSGLANGNGYNGATSDINGGSGYIKAMNDDFFEKMMNGDDSYGRSHR